MLNFLGRKGFASMLQDRKAGEPCQTLEIRWT